MSTIWLHVSERLQQDFFDIILLGFSEWLPLIEGLLVVEFVFLAVVTLILRQLFNDWIFIKTKEIVNLRRWISIADRSFFSWSDWVLLYASVRRYNQRIFLYDIMEGLPLSKSRRVNGLVQIKIS